MDAITKMADYLKNISSPSKPMPVKAYALKSYIDKITEQTSLVKDSKFSPPSGAIASLAGITIYETELLPKGMLCLFLDKDSKPVGKIVDETYVPLAKQPQGGAE